MGIKTMPGTDGVQRMSKSTGNIVPINTGAKDIYGKIMSVPDMAMGKFMRLATRWTPEDIDAFEAEIEGGKIHPRDAKMKIAREITSIFYGDDEAKDAEAAFIQIFQKGNVPDDMKEYQLQEGQSVLDVLSDSGLVSSRGEGRRMVKQNAVSLDDAKLTDALAEFPGSGVLRVGRRKFLKVVA
jgi:tyrosyl-tRNA synthetase